MLHLCQQRNLYNNMADVNKTKLQLRSGLTVNGDRTPSPSAKLLINHGKPNFTIPRSYKTQNGNTKPTSPTPAAAAYNVGNNNNNNKDFVVRSTTFNGVFKPSNISAATKQTLPQNGNTNNGFDNEAAQVTLRRTKKFVPPETRGGDNDNDENVPEFIRRQRRIQERLANQNILDFENRRSGYFTQVLISPTNPNRQSFVETMASPAIKPGLEMPPLAAYEEKKKEDTSPNQLEHEQQQQQQGQSEVENSAETTTIISNCQVEEEEVAKAIEEVNKAVEGEDDDKIELEEHSKSFPEEETEKETESSVTPLQYIEKTKLENDEAQQNETTALENKCADETPVTVTVTTSDAQVIEQHENGHVITADPILGEKIAEHKTNGVVEVNHVQNDFVEENLVQNGHSNGQTSDSEITISHTNCLNSPSIPSPDPKGEKGVNFEPKTVVSFSQELGNGDNKYPDTVKVVKDVEIDSDLKDLSKLKFEIKADSQDIEVKPVLVTETA